MAADREDIDNAFEDYYQQVMERGFGDFLKQPLERLLFMVYRAGYIRGGSDRVRREAGQALGCVEHGLEPKPWCPACKARLTHA